MKWTWTVSLRWSDLKIFWFKSTKRSRTWAGPSLLYGLYWVFVKLKIGVEVFNLKVNFGKSNPLFSTDNNQPEKFTVLILRLNLWKKMKKNISTFWKMRKKPKNIFIKKSRKSVTSSNVGIPNYGYLHLWTSRTKFSTHMFESLTKRIRSARF